MHVMVVDVLPSMLSCDFGFGPSLIEFAWICSWVCMDLLDSPYAAHICSFVGDTTQQ